MLCDGKGVPAPTLPAGIPSMAKESMQTEIEVLRDITHKLTRLEIPFMVTGSLAMMFYSLMRMTRDIDVVVELSLEDVDRFLDAFEPDYYIFPDEVRAAVRTRRLFNAIHQHSVMKVDFISRKESEYGKVAFARRRAFRIRDFETWVTSPEDLILAKLAWSSESRSETQQKDIRALLATDCDRAYVLDWAGKLGLAEWLKECSHE